MLVARQRDSHIHERITCQREAVPWLQEAVLREYVQVPIHLDGMQPFLNAVIVQRTNTTLGCLVVIRPVR